METVQKIEKEIVAQLGGKIIQPKNLRLQELRELAAIQFPVEEFSWKGRANYGYVLDIVDGDTISVALYDRNHAEYSAKRLVKLNVRLFGIDTPEQRPRLDDPNRTTIKIMAAESHKHLQQLLQLDGNVRVFTFLFIEHDKYGRPLAILYKDDEFNVLLMKDAWQQSVNKKMIDDGYALPYNGGTKWTFEIAQSHFSRHSRNIAESWQLESPVCPLIIPVLPKRTFWQKLCDKFKK